MSGQQLPVGIAGSSEKYSVRDDVSAGSSELEVQDVGLKDSGVYACFQQVRSPERGIFQLSVYGKPRLGLLRCTSVKCDTTMPPAFTPGYM